MYQVRSRAIYDGDRLKRRDAFDLGQFASISGEPDHTRAIERAFRDFLMRKHDVGSTKHAILSSKPRKQLTSIQLRSALAYPPPALMVYIQEPFAPVPVRFIHLPLGVSTPEPLKANDTSKQEPPAFKSAYDTMNESAPYYFEPQEYSMEDWTNAVYNIFRFPTHEDPEGTPISMDEARDIAGNFLRSCQA